jgi:polyhydroxyalkanoate synthesis regulator phasin
MREYAEELNRRMEMVRQVSTVLRSTIQKVGTVRNNSQDVSDSLVLAGEFSDNLAKAVSKLKYEIDTALDYVVRTFGKEE